MGAPTDRRAHVGRTMMLMTASSMLVPVGGILTAPVLARALSPFGRGEFAAAVAPSALILAAATLGLPDALTFMVAKFPERTRTAILGTSVVTLVLGLICFAITIACLPFLAAGSQDLAWYIVLGTALTIPALMVGSLRGAATGAQMWREIVWERVLLTVLRVGALGILFLTGQLHVVEAVVVAAVVPWLSGLVYLRVLLPRHSPPRPPGVAPQRVVALTRELASYGSKVWLGSVAGMLLARVSSLLMVPLASTEELGIYAVAVTISDVPVIVAFTIQGTLFSLTSRSADAREITAVSRITLAAATICCGGMAIVVPFLVVPFFGAEFAAATGPTVILLLAAVVSVPGLMCASGISAWGRPGLRSLVLLLTLTTNVVAFFALVPTTGAVGAAWANVISSGVMSVTMVAVASRLMKSRARDAVLLRRSDIERATRTIRGRLSRA